MSDLLDHPIVRWLAVILASAIAWLGVIVIRRLVPPEELGENNTFTSSTFGFIGLVYGVYLAFTVVIVWQNFENAEEIASNEATELAQLWRDAEILPGHDAIRADLYAYTRSVIEDDWPSMKAGKGADPRTTRIYNDLWRKYYNEHISNEATVKKVFYEESLRELNNLARDRQLRLTAGKADLPWMMWGLLIFGGVGMICLTLLLGTRHSWVQIAVTVFVAAMLTHAVMIVGALVNPFGGELSVKPSAYENLLKMFAEDRSVTPAQPLK
jgi:hypothetical protein